MSQENVEIVKALQPSGVDFVAIMSGDQAAIAVPANALTEDFESVFIAEGGRTSIGPNQGVDGFAAGWRDWLEPWDSYELHAEEFLDAGDKVVVFARAHCRTRRDGVEIEHAPAAVYTLRDGRICRVAFYLDRAEALLAAGLAPG